MPVFAIILLDVFKNIFIKNFKYILLIGFIFLSIFTINQWLKSYYTKSIEQKNHTKDVVIDVFKKNEENLLNNIYQIKQSNQIDQTTVSDNLEHKKNIEENKNKKNTELDKKVNKIKKEYKERIDKEKDLETKLNLVIKQEKKISETRINSLWDSYCQSNKKDNECH